jgi:UDPglucose--hexose-1-phosphate uridylyltransferase
MNQPSRFTAPHRRLNLLTGEWVLVSPHRTARPWRGVLEQPLVETFVFDNDFPTLLPDTERQQLNGDELLVAESERGLCRVVCYSSRHDLTLAEMELDSIARVVDVWAEQYAELGAIPWVRHVQIFENRGASMGASNPHPHGQIWADERLPNEPVKELRQQRTYAADTGIACSATTCRSSCASASE